MHKNVSGNLGTENVEGRWHDTLMIEPSRASDKTGNAFGIAKASLSLPLNR
jgi:hypothetical protein